MELQAASAMGAVVWRAGVDGRGAFSVQQSGEIAGRASDASGKVYFDGYGYDGERCQLKHQFDFERELGLHSQIRNSILSGARRV
jgi:hypothetical protein